MDLLEPPLRLLTCLLQEPKNVYDANKVLMACMDVVYEHNDNMEVLPRVLQIAILVLKSGQVTIDFIESNTLKFMCQLCELYDKMPEVLGYLLGVVCMITFLSRSNLERLEDFHLCELAMNTQKAYAKSELVQQYSSGILSLYANVQEYQAMMVDRKVIGDLLNAMYHFSDKLDLVQYCLEGCSCLVDLAPCLTLFLERNGVSVALKCMLAFSEDLGVIMTVLRLCYLAFLQDATQVEQMAHEQLLESVLYALKNLTDEEEVASVLQILQVICSNKACCEVALKLPFLRVFMDIHSSFTEDIQINEKILGIMWYMADCDAMRDVLFSDKNFDLIPMMMSDFKREKSIQLSNCRLLYKLSARYDMKEPLCEKEITNNLLEVVDVFPKDYDILRPALRAISNLLNKDMLKHINVSELLNTACAVLKYYARRTKFVLEVLDLVVNLAKSLTPETPIRVKEMLDHMFEIMSSMHENVDVVVKVLLVIEMMIPADPKGQELAEEKVLQKVLHVSREYEKNGDVQVGVYRVINALLDIPLFVPKIVKELNALMRCMDRFAQKKEVQTVCVEVLTKLCASPKVLSTMGTQEIDVLDTLLQRFPYDKALVLATIRCINRLLEVEELNDYFVEKKKGAVRIFSVMKSFKDMDLLQATLQIVDKLVLKDPTQVRRLLVEYCDILLVMVSACSEYPGLLEEIGKRLCDISQEIHNKLVSYTEDISAMAVHFAENKAVVKYLYSLLSEAATERDMELLKLMHDKGVTQATIKSITMFSTSKSLVKSAAGLMAALVAYEEAAHEFATDETILMLNRICQDNL